MKTFIRSLAGKITLFFFCVLLLVVSVAGGLCAYILAEEGFYRYDRQQLVETVQYDMIQAQVDDLIYFVTIQRFSASDYAIYDPSRTNLRFLITSPTGTKIDSNVPGATHGNDPVWRYRFHHLQQFGSSADVEYLLYVYLEEDLPVQDQYATVTATVNALYDLRYWLAPISLGALLLSILCYICLLCGAGRQPRSELSHPGPLHRIPFDVLVAGTGGIYLFAVWVLDQWSYTDLAAALTTALFGVAVLCGVIGLSLSLASRIKAQDLIKGTLTYKLCALFIKLCKLTLRFIKLLFQKALSLLRRLPLIWRSGLAVLVFGIADFLLFAAVARGEDIAILLWLLRTVLLTLLALYGALFMRRLQAGGRALAAGDLEHRVDTKMMFWDFKEHGENLNRISDGMTTAVEQRLQSERTKTELITNVSHDIKTPLTSIINYAGLIAQEECNCENHSQYADVLLRKSQHLKRLLDDLVEISRATTGNLDVLLAACDAGVLLNQISGEYQQRLDEAGLILVPQFPEEAVLILADNRRLWRVLDNLLSNVCKYSLPGSRVILSLTKEGQEACIVLRNTAGTILNITPQDLMERFVRGDEARSTEGSGLGLSIAQSLTTLQGGRLDISIDADIFKVTLHFPLVQ